MNRKARHSEDVHSFQVDTQAMQFPIKTPARLFVAIDKMTLKFKWKSKEIKTAKAILKKQ